MTEEEFYKKMEAFLVNSKAIMEHTIEDVFPPKNREALANALKKLAGELKEYNDTAEKMTYEEAEAYLKDTLHGYTKERFEKEFKGKTATRQSFSVYVTYAITHSFMMAIVCGKHKELRDRLPGIIDEYVNSVYPSKGKFNYTPPEMQNYPNDKVSKAVRSATEKEYAAGTITAIERKASPQKKLSQIETTVQMDLSRLRELGYANPTPFDCYVIYTAFSIQMAGNEVTTINSIYRAMTGKGEKDRPPSDEMRDAIADSLIKGMSTILAILPEGIRKAYKKDLKRAEGIGPMLPIEIGRATVKGVDVDNAVIFHGKSPLVRAAEIKGNQFATYETALLNVPYRVSMQNILIAPFLLGHIEDSRRGGVAKIINIDNLSDALGYEGHRTRLVKCVEQCFEYWKSVKHISKYELEKDGRGKVIRVKYTLPKKSKELPEG